VRNGAIYITSMSYLEENSKLVSPNPAYYVMDRTRGVNIDEPDDLIMAEALLSLGY
jgi:CMP-N-acetylneuraminic acid synthetase